MRTYIILTRLKSRPDSFELYAVSASSPEMALPFARTMLGPNVAIGSHIQLAPPDLAKLLDLKPGEVRKF